MPLKADEGEFAMTVTVPKVVEGKSVVTVSIYLVGGSQFTLLFWSFVLR